MKKALTFMTVILFFTVHAVAVDAWDGVSVASGFAGGDGSANNPYLISTPQELAYLEKQVNESGMSFLNTYFKLTADIDLNRHSWTPIGAHEGGGPNQAYFNGNFDGDGYVIANLYINLPDRDDVGLFGFIQGDTIKNLGIVGNSEIIGKNNVGALTGKCYSSAGKPDTGIFNCFSSATVTATGSNCGGLIGSMYKRNTVVRIYNCYTTGAVSGYGDIGGIVGGAGRYEAGEMKHCYSLAMVTSHSSDKTPGGLVGAGVLTLTNSYHVYGASTNGGIRKSLEEMKAPAMVSLLNASQATVEWKADIENQYLNEGFPVLFVRRALQAQLSKTSVNIATMVHVGKSDVVALTTSFETTIDDVEISLRQGTAFTISPEQTDAHTITVNLSFETDTEGEYKDTLSIYVKSRSARILVPLIGFASSQPFIALSHSSLAFTANEGETVTQSFTLTGAFLQNDVQLSIEGDAGFSLDKTLLTAAEANAGVVVTVHFTGVSDAAAVLKATSLLDGGGEVGNSLTLTTTVSPGPIFLEAALTANYDDYAVVRVASDSLTSVFYLIVTERQTEMTASEVRTHPERNCMDLEYKGEAEALFFEDLQKEVAYYVYLALGKGVAVKEISFIAGVSSSIENVRTPDYLAYGEKGSVVVRSDTETNRQIRVYDTRGALVGRASEIARETRIPVNAPGVYIVSIFSEGVSTTSKVMVK